VHGDVPAPRQMRHVPPQEVVLHLARPRRLERHHLAPLRVHAGKHGTDGAVLAAAIHRLEHRQHRLTVLGVQPLLQLHPAAPRRRPADISACTLSSPAHIHLGRMVLQAELATLLHPAGRQQLLHGRPSAIVSSFGMAGRSCAACPGHCGPSTRPGLQAAPLSHWPRPWFRTTPSPPHPYPTPCSPPAQPGHPARAHHRSPRCTAAPPPKAPLPIAPPPNARPPKPRNRPDAQPTRAKAGIAPMPQPPPRHPVPRIRAPTPSAGNAARRPSSAPWRNRMPWSSSPSPRWNSTAPTSRCGRTA
jgi:hypothetical protein